MEKKERWRSEKREGGEEEGEEEEEPLTVVSSLAVLQASGVVHCVVGGEPAVRLHDGGVLGLQVRAAVARELELARVALHHCAAGGEVYIAGCVERLH